MTLSVVICDPTFFKKHHDEHPKGVWKKKLVWKDDWVKDWKIVKQASAIEDDKLVKVVERVLT